MEWEKRSAYVFVKCCPGKTESVFNMIKEWDSTIGVFTLGGKWDLMTWIDTENTEETYKWISKIRFWPEVERTCTHMAYFGYRSEEWFEEKPAWTWVKVRSNEIYSTYEDLKKYEWVNSVASIPGEWDCVAMVYANNYEELYQYLWQLQTRGYDIEYYAPLKCYWNQTWKEKWSMYTAIETAGAY